jgi:hypothetical protein
LKSVSVRAVTIHPGFWSKRRRTRVESSISSLRVELIEHERMDSFLPIEGESHGCPAGAVCFALAPSLLCADSVRKGQIRRPYFTFYICITQKHAIPVLRAGGPFGDPNEARRIAHNARELPQPIGGVFEIEEQNLNRCHSLHYVQR